MPSTVRCSSGAFPKTMTPGPPWVTTNGVFQKLLQYFRRIESDTEFGGGDFHNSDGPILVRRFKPEEWRPDQKAFYNAWPGRRLRRLPGPQPARWHRASDHAR